MARRAPSLTPDSGSISGTEVLNWPRYEVLAYISLMDASFGVLELFPGDVIDFGFPNQGVVNLGVIRRGGGQQTFYEVLVEENFCDSKSFILKKLEFSSNPS